MSSNQKQHLAAVDGEKEGESYTVYLSINALTIAAILVSSKIDAK